MASPIEPDGEINRVVARNLLLGLLAFQNGFIDRDALLGAFNAWVADRSRPLGQLLHERGALDASRHSLLEALVREHLGLHDDDPEKSLASLSSLGPVMSDLSRIPADDVRTTIEFVGRDWPDPEATVDYTPPRRGSGDRFRILKFHAEGGLGRVYEAEDTELGRKVALKEIQPGKAHRPDLRSRFVLEAEITGALEHPGIIPVYGLGTYADGRPFYAMRFIKGDSLKQAIWHFHKAEWPARDTGGRSLGLRQLLGRFLDVCNAIAYAHSCGVLHRDLKPGNILLGPYGETLVVDWGLAKVIGRPEGPGGMEVTSRPGPARGSSETMPGTALGTPQYMSPEQAAGALERLGPASDVYSLGATLYCLLTGQPPFEEDDSGAVMRAVQKGEFPKPRELDPAIDRALEAVCLKAMALEPEDRYASPRTLADDVERWMADEPVTAWREPTAVRARRWLARHRTLVRVGVAGIIIASIGLSSFALIEADARGRIEGAYFREKRSKAVAQGRLNLALEAVKAYHTDVTEDVLLKTPEMKDLRTKLLRWPLDFYRRMGELPTLEGQDPNNRATLAEMYMRLAQLTAGVGTKAQAIEAYRRANALLEAISRDDPKAVKPLLDAAFNHNQIALLCRDMGRYPEALESYRAALRIRESLSRANPADAGLKAYVANVHSNIGLLLVDMGKEEEARAAHRVALDIREALARDQPDSALFRQGLAMSHLNIGNMLRGAERLASYQKAVELNASLIRDSPENDGYRLELITAHENVGDAQGEVGNLDEARRSLGEALGLLEPMVREYPTMIKYRESLSRISSGIGRVRYEAGELDEAIAMYRKSAELDRRLADDDPYNADAAVSEAYCHCQVGHCYVKLRKFDDSERAFIKARDLYRKLADADPENSEIRTRLDHVSSHLEAVRRKSNR